MTQQEVVDLVRHRVRSGRRDDGARLALVIEGGGMRGIVSAAMTCVLEETGILDAVDLIVGTSSGGVNAAAAAAGVIAPMTAAYVEIFSSREFVDPRRLLTRRSVVDSASIVTHIDRLFEVSGVLRRSGGPQLAVVATDIASAQSEALTHFTDRDDLLNAVHASGLLPILGGPPLQLRGRRWLDGGIVEPVPVASAARLGATHAVVLGTRPPGGAPAAGPADRVVLRHLSQLNPDLAEKYRARGRRYRRVVADARRGRVGEVRTLLLLPDLGSPQPSRLDRSPERLRAALDEARSSALRQLGHLDLLPPGITRAAGDNAHQ